MMTGIEATVLAHEMESTCKENRVKKQKEPGVQYHPEILFRLGLICEKETNHIFKVKYVILILHSITELIICYRSKSLLSKVCLKANLVRAMAI